MATKTPTRNRIVETRNLRMVFGVFRQLLARPAGDPGILLIYGEPGYGKTCSACELFLENQGVQLGVLPGWTQRAMVSSLLTEMGIEPLGNTVERTEQVINALNHDPRPIFVDELELLFGEVRLLETLRIIHDRTGCPLVLIGASGVEIKIKKLKQLASRIFYWCQFTKAELEDARLLAQAVIPGVTVSEDLLTLLWTTAAGNMRDIKSGLGQISEVATNVMLTEIGLEHWGSRTFFFRQGGR
jgi:DNA transposition AAA+ family ATPase